MIAFWTIVILAALALLYIWYRLIQLVIPSKTLEIESNPYAETSELQKSNDGHALKPPVWKRWIRFIFQ